MNQYKRKKTKNIRKFKKRSKNRCSLFYTRRWHPARWKTSGVPTKLKKANQTQLALIRYQGGISNPVQQTTHILEGKDVQDVQQRTGGNQYGSEVIYQLSNYRTIAKPGHSFSLKLVHSSGGHQGSTDIRLSEDQPVCSMPTFQDEGHSSTEGIDRRE